MRRISIEFGLVPREFTRIYTNRNGISNRARKLMTAQRDFSQQTPLLEMTFFCPRAGIRVRNPDT